MRSRAAARFGTSRDEEKLREVLVAPREFRFLQPCDRGVHPGVVDGCTEIGLLRKGLIPYFLTHGDDGAR